MTHSEIRGMLVLLALMLAIVGGTALWRGCSSPRSAPAEEISSIGTNADSLVLEHQARRLAAEDSLARQETVSRRKSAARRPRRQAERHSKPSPSPTPSPLDRPAPSK